MICHEDAARAEEMVNEYMCNYFLSIIKHYEIMSDHFKETKGYDHYASAAEAFRAVGLETAARMYCQIQTWGTPEMILEKLRWRRELLGEFELDVIASYGGLPLEEAEKSLRLFASEVLPELHRW